MPLHIAGSSVGHGSLVLRLRLNRGHAAALICLAAGLGGCMTLGDHTPPPAVAPPPIADAKPMALSPVSLPAVPPKPRPRKAAREVHEARENPELHTLHDRLVVIDPQRLIGLDPSSVQKLLGSPVRVQDRELSREWVYVSPGCNFRVFFYPNLNAASFRVLKYGGSNDNGELLAVSDACVRRILTAKSDAAD